MDNFDLESAKKQITKPEKAHLIFLAILLFFLALMTSVLNKYQVYLSIGSKTFSPSSLSGMISGFFVAIAILMVQIHWHYGSIIAYAFVTFYAGMVAISIFGMHNTEALPGFFFVLTSYLILAIQVLNLKKVSKTVLLNKKFAITDPLTGIYNRRGLTTYINDLILEKKPFYVLFIDLDNFKTINDTHGHSTGDYILTVMVERWSNLVRNEGIIARNGGDEFVIVVPDSEKEIGPIDYFASKCIECTKEEIFIKDKNISEKISSTIGIALYPADGQTSDQLLTNADIAMYEAKNSGKDRFTFFR